MFSKPLRAPTQPTCTGSAATGLAEAPRLKKSDHRASHAFLPTAAEAEEFAKIAGDEGDFPAERLKNQASLPTASLTPALNGLLKIFCRGKMPASECFSLTKRRRAYGYFGQCFSSRPVEKTRRIGACQAPLIAWCFSLRGRHARPKSKE